MKPVRYAVVGLGHISQVAVLPAFAHARANSRLAALVSGDEAKLRRLGRRYGVEEWWSYPNWGRLLASGKIDAAYIALPNHLHHPFALAALRAGVHVLCEKPLAVDERECRELIRASRRGVALLMTAYRLHFDAATLAALKLARLRRMGRPRFLQASLSIKVKDPSNIRRGPRSKGGGPLYDLGIYCLNAARMFFGEEPIEAAAFTQGRTRRLLPGAEESAVGLLRFPGGGLAGLACSVATGDLSEFSLACERGSVRLENAFDYASARELCWEAGGREGSRRFPKSDQFAAELLYFSGCIQKGRQPQPSGWEGMADVRVIQALQRSAARGRPQRLRPLAPPRRPRPGQEIRRPPVRPPEPVDAKSPRD